MQYSWQLQRRIKLAHQVSASEFALCHRNFAYSFSDGCHLNLSPRCSLFQAAAASRTTHRYTFYSSKIQRKVCTRLPDHMICTSLGFPTEPYIYETSPQAAYTASQASHGMVFFFNSNSFICYLESSGVCLAGRSTPPHLPPGDGKNRRLTISLESSEDPIRASDIAGLLPLLRLHILNHS